MTKASLTILPVLVLSTACASMTGGTLIDDTVLDNASELGDTELVSDVQQMHGKRLAPGSGELHAAMCLQQYVRGRKAELALPGASDDYARRVAQSEMLQGYGTCAAQCKYAVEQMPSKFTPIAAKYTARCEAGASTSEEGISTDSLERLVASYRDATQPLELYFADRDSRALIEHLRGDGMANDTVEALAAEVESLGQSNADAIERGRAFFNSGPAQENFRLRAANEAKQASLEASMRRLQAEYEEASEAGLVERATNLQLEYAAQTVLLEQTIAEHAALKAHYEQMAAEAGVYAQP